MKCYFAWTETCDGEVKRAGGTDDNPWSGTAHFVNPDEVGYCEAHRQGNVDRAREDIIVTPNSRRARLRRLTNAHSIANAA